MIKRNGWLIDLYEHPTKGVVLWLAGEDGKPYSFYQEFETVFYARGEAQQLHNLGVFIRAKCSKEIVRLTRDTKDDLFDGPQEVMGIGAHNGKTFGKLFREVQENFPNLIYYNVDVPFTVRYAAAHDVFMMARCEVVAEDDGKILRIKALDTPYDLDPQLPKLRLLSLRPDTNPAFKTPKYLIVKFEKSYLRLPFDKPHELLSILNGILTSFDPDVIHTYFGDHWLLPHLLELSQKTGIPFTPNRDFSLPVLQVKPIKIFNYGRPHYRALQTHLRGRWHIDIKNCMNYSRLIGAIEHTRLSSMPLQEVARRSPGASISAMQTLTALRLGILIPYQRQKAEIAKTFNEFYRAARGGLILQPPIGIYANIGVMDFSSKMASIMIKYNVSPETVVPIDDGRDGFEIPQLKLKILPRPGLIPLTLQPMRDKRLALKRYLKSMDKSNPQYKTTKYRYNLLAKLTNVDAVVESIKWLTVVCYGRLRFANSIFGRINSHEAVSYLSRKAILEAKRIAQEKGGRVLHLYVDSLIVSLPSASKEDFQALANEIAEKTGLPMELENVYSWFAFLSSRQNPNISVANKFFGVAENGDHKIRGIAVRRGNTCAFVAHLQRQILEIMAREKDPTKIGLLLPEIMEVTHQRLTALKNKEIPLEELIVSQTLSRELKGYSVMSPTAVAARQLEIQGTTLERGQTVQFIYITRGPGVHAWDLETKPDSNGINVRQYREFAFRAIHELLQPLGVRERVLKDWMFQDAAYVMPADLVNPSQQIVHQELPLLADLRYLRVDKF